MEQYQVNKTTYLLHRIFTGEKTAVQLVEERIKTVSCQALPLTDSASISYNTGGNQSAVRRSK